MKAPAPPASLTVDPHRDYVRYEGHLWRINRAHGRHAATWNELRRFGPIPGMRFDPHPLPMGNHDRGVMYAAADIPTTFAEVFQASRVITRNADQELVGWKPTRPLVLLNLMDTFLVRNGASFSLAVGQKRHTQAWARLIDETLGGRIDGIQYASAITGRRAVALFEHSAGSFPARAGFQRNLDSPAMLRLLGRVVADLETFGLR